MAEQRSEPQPQPKLMIRLPDPKRRKEVEDAAWRRRMSMNAWVNEAVQEKLERERRKR